MLLKAGDKQTGRGQTKLPYVTLTNHTFQSSYSLVCTEIEQIVSVFNNNNNNNN